MKKLLITPLIIAFLFAWAAGVPSISASEKNNDPMPPIVDQSTVPPTKGLVQLDSKNVTRINTNNPIEAAIRVSQSVWPATHDENRPGTIILAPMNSWQAAIAASNLIHHPNDGPLLFYKTNRGIPYKTLNEIKRLNPKGNPKGTQIIVIGDPIKKAKDELKDFKVKYIAGKTPAEIGNKVDATYTELSGDLPNGVLIISQDDEDQLYSLPALSWVAHMPEPPLFVSTDKIPKATQEALEKRKGKANIYILGPESSVSGKVAKQLKKYGKVKRIAGSSPVANAIAFAKFKDKKTGFGWGINEPGHGLTFVSTERPQLALLAGAFAHKGKHAPMMLLEKGQLTKEVETFLKKIQPTYEKDPTKGPYNHAFFLGDTMSIPYQTQGMIDHLLEIEKVGGMKH